jgi:parvulin-like peptidyl-prolyl isomerase
MSKVRPSGGTPTRKQLSRAERERRLRGYILIGTLVVAVIVLGLIGYGIVEQAVLQPRQPVARVGAEQISTADFQKAVRFRRYQLVSQYQQMAQFVEQDPQFEQFFGSQLQQIAAQLQNLTGLGQQVLDELIEDRLIRQEAARRGITVSREEVDARMGESFNYFPGGTPTPTITPSPLPSYAAPTLNPTTAAQWTPTPTITPTATLTPTATHTPGPTPTATATSTPLPTATPYTAEGYAVVVATTVKNLQTQAGFNEADLRNFIESQIYREKVLQAVTADTPASDEQVHARHILISVSETATEEEKTAAKAKADEVLAKLKAGEDWDALAAQYSGDPSNAQNGGDLGWFGAGQMVAEFEAAAFATPVGQISEVVETQFGYHIIQVLGHEERPLTNDQIEQNRQTAFSAWLQAQRAGTDAAGKPNVEVFDRWQERVPTTPDIVTG